jgi:hypothetical protein
VQLALDWPADARVKSLRVRWQTALGGAWSEAVHPIPDGAADAPRQISLGRFDRPTPISYRVDATLEGDLSAELWGYLQVRADPKEPPRPHFLSDDLRTPRETPVSAAEPSAPRAAPAKEIDLLALANPKSCWMNGEWSMVDGRLESPKQYGARFELPYEPPSEYVLTLIVEPLDEPHGLLAGHCLGGERFVTLFNFTRAQSALSAIENVDGKNVGNETTIEAPLFQKNRLSHILVAVRKTGVTADVDGRRILDWKGMASQLSLSDYWKTPNDRALFLGAYDCRYRFYRISLEPLSGEGRAANGRSAE